MRRQEVKRPAGVLLLVAFFLFGTIMCALTILALTFPGTPLAAIWRMNPEAKDNFARMGAWAFPLMAVVGGSCAAAAIGLWRWRNWGRRVAIGVLGANLVGDLMNALVRHDYRTLIGLPIAGVMIWYLASRAWGLGPGA